MEFGSIIWIILIGGMFYLMMRKGGCCGGHSKKQGHEGHGRSENNKTGDSGAAAENEHKNGCH